MWGTDENWIRVANYCPDMPEYTVLTTEIVKISLVRYMDNNPADRGRVKCLMQENGIWEQAQQIAKENDLNIQP